MSRYNGWTNYETWNVALHIDNEEGSHFHWRQRTRDMFEATGEDFANITGLSKTFTHLERATLRLADELRDEITEGNPLAESVSLYSDILTANLSQVNWHEIAENWLSDVEDDEA